MPASGPIAVQGLLRGVSAGHTGWWTFEQDPLRSTAMDIFCTGRQACSMLSDLVLWGDSGADLIDAPGLLIGHRACAEVVA